MKTTIDDFFRVNDSDMVEILRGRRKVANLYRAQGGQDQLGKSLAIYCSIINTLHNQFLAYHKEDWWSYEYAMCTYGTGRIYASLTFYDAAEQNIKEAIQSLTDHMPDAFSDLSLLKDFLDMMGCLYREVYMPAAYNTNDTDGVDAVNKRTSWSDKTRGLLSMLSSLITSHNSSAVDGTKSEYVEDEVSTLTCDSDCSENILHTLQSTFTSCEVLAKVLCWSSCRVLHEIVSLAGQIYLQVGMGRVAIKIYACALKACESNGVVMENTCTEDVFNQLAELRRDYVRCILRVCNDGSHATYSTLYHPPGDRLEWLKDAELALTVLTTASHRQEDMELWADLLCLQGGTRNELLSVCLYAACFISQHAEESTEVKCRLAHSLARKSRPTQYSGDIEFSGFSIPYITFLEREQLVFTTPPHTVVVDMDRLFEILRSSDKLLTDCNRHTTIAACDPNTNAGNLAEVFTPFIATHANYFMLTRRETCCFHSLLVFLTEKCSIALGCAQQYAARMLEANGIYSLDMLLATWNADAGYWKSVAGSNQSHIKSAEKELHIMRARVMQLAQYPDLPLEAAETKQLSQILSVHRISDAHFSGLAKLYHALLHTPMLSRVALGICDCLVKDWGILTLDSVATEIAAAASSKSFVLSQVHSITQLRRENKEFWVEQLELPWSRFVLGLQQQTHHPGHPFASYHDSQKLLMDTIDLCYSNLTLAVRGDTHALQWLVCNQSDSSQPLVMMSKACLMLLTDEGLAGLVKNRTHTVELGSEVFNFLQQALYWLPTGDNCTSHRQCCIVNCLLAYCLLKCLHCREAINSLTLAAGYGLDLAQCKLGKCYYYGDGVDKDIGRAVNWWTRAAEQGNATAQNRLGSSYNKGEGVPRDVNKAIEWWTKAAEQGRGASQFLLGLRYYNGEGVERDLTKAVELWTKAAVQDRAGSQYHLAECYRKGEGVPVNLSEAKMWYERAAGLGHHKATKALELYFA